MSVSYTDDKARDLFQVLSESGVMQDPPSRKRLAKALAEEDIPVADLRRRCQRLGRVDEWLRILVHRKHENGAPNMPTDAERSNVDQATIDYVIERVRTDGKPVEFVAQQMGWPVSRVEELVGGQT